MADRATTFRTDSYRRKIPYPGPTVYTREEDDTRGNAALGDVKDDIKKKVLEASAKSHEKIRDAFPWLSSVIGLSQKSRDERRDSLLESNPWLAPMLDEIARARISMYQSDDPNMKSKKMGWKATGKAMEPPEDSEFFTLGYDPETEAFGIWETPEGQKLRESSPEEYQKALQPYSQWMDAPFTYTIEPSERIDFDKLGEGEGWYGSTNEILDALLATKLSERDRQALYDLAQQRFGQMVIDNPELSEFIEEMPNGERLPRVEFRAPTVYETFGANALTPSLAAVMMDPELRYKTGTGEKVARGVTDAALNAGAIVLPAAGAVKGASVLGRPLVGSVIGGAAGGAANYGLQRGLNTGFEFLTGKGTDEYPIDAADLATNAVLGAVTGPMVGANRVRGDKSMREKMNKADPSSVKKRDIEASAKYMKEAQGDKDAAKRAFAGEGYKKYREAYPDEGRVVEGAPVPRAEGLPLAMELEGTDIGSYEIHDPSKFFDKLYGKAGRHESSGKIVDPTRRRIIVMPDGSEYPAHTGAVAWSKPNPHFVESYVKENPKYFTEDRFSKESLAGLGQTLRKAQSKGSPESKFFRGEDVPLRGGEFAKTSAMYSGETIDDATKKTNQLMKDILRNSKVANVDKSGNVTPATPKQIKAEGEAKKEYTRRKNMKMVTETDIKEAKGNKPRDVLYKGAGGLGAVIGRNVIPFGSNIIMGVEPYSYEE